MTEFIAGLAMQAMQAMQLQALSWGWRLLMALLIFFIGRWIARRISTVVSRALDRAGGDPMLSGFVGTFSFGLVLAVVIVAALNQLGVPSASLLAALGAAGLAIGLPCRDHWPRLPRGCC